METTGFELMQIEANRLQWPKSYKSDLDIDKQAISHDGDIDCFWIIRENGTHLICQSDSRKKNIFYMEAIKSNYPNESDFRVYHFQRRKGRSTLTCVSFDSAIYHCRIYDLVFPDCKFT